jgi:hypothetical protein
VKLLNSGSRTLLIFAILTIIAFVVWILVAIFINNIFNLSEDSLKAVEALSAALTVATVFGAGYFAIQELSEASKTRYMEISDKLFNELNSPENIDARRLVYGLKTKKPNDDLNQDQKNAIKKVLNSLDHVAFLTQKGWIPDEIIMPWMHPMIAKTWQILEPYVINQRQQRGEPYYYEHASELAGRCFDWREKHNIDKGDYTFIDDKAI